MGCERILGIKRIFPCSFGNKRIRLLTRVYGIWYRESQLSLVVTLWLSGVVVDRAFTSGGGDARGRLFIDYCCVTVFICVSNFCCWSQP